MVNSRISKYNYEQILTNRRQVNKQYYINKEIEVKHMEDNKLIKKNY